MGSTLWIVCHSARVMPAYSNNLSAIPTPLRDKLPSASTPAVRNKLAQLLQFAARGVRENPTASAEDLMVGLGWL